MTNVSPHTAAIPIRAASATGARVAVFMQLR
jgi:hypothetical protein